ncbi:unnamed protein product, partial [Iphiclides podalirius]
MDDLPNFIDGVSIDGQEVYNAGEHSVILMVIDGLRYDFATEEYMPYTGELLKNKSACIYVSVAEPPTVTMPRIKAMMTGSISTFADVALNFGAPAVRGDSVLRVASSRGRRSVLYGDDTWLRLFPGMWAEHDGTTSFYVTDYTEVDNNVTRHLDKILTPDENSKPVFDFLVLHYLGLDHIGHLEGARSLKIKPKLIEMDQVVEKIYTAMQKWDRTGVLIVCGDHGMRDAGGHGGATTAEVLVPLLVLKSDGFQCPHPLGPGPTVAQVDVAPTVAWLLRAPPPGDSAGRVLPALMPADTRQHLYLLHTLALGNARSGLPTSAEFYMQFKRAEKQFAQYLSTGQRSAAKIAKEFYDESLQEMSKYLTETTAEFDLFAITLATVLLYMIAASLLCVTLYSLQTETRPKSLHGHARSTLSGFIAFLVMYLVFSCSLVIACFITETRSRFCSFEPLWCVGFLAAAFAITVAYFLVKAAVETVKDTTALRELNAIDHLLILGTLFHSWSFFGTSFIEEEHHDVRWSGATETQEKPELEGRMGQVGVGILPQWVLLIALHRYLRTMNQTGDRWLFLPDTADWLNAPENAFYLQAHLLIGTVSTLGICLWNVRHMNNRMHVHTALTAAAGACVMLYRIAAGALDSPHPWLGTLDKVAIVDVFWALLAAQFLYETLSYVGVFRVCSPADGFGYSKPKEKTEDHHYEAMDEPWSLDSAKLTLARSLTHLMLNDLMLIIALLMRPHNVIMVPSVIATCSLTARCLDHSLLDYRSGRGKEVADLIGQTLAHLWIGMLFFFYQGNSNSLASVDLGAGYVGLSAYCPLRVAARMGLHAYAGPALSGAALYCRLADRAPHWTSYLESVWRVCNVHALHRVYSVAVYALVALVFRHHLFVWSVFSPKLLYDLAATVLAVQALATVAQIVVLTNLTARIARALAYRAASRSPPHPPKYVRVTLAEGLHVAHPLFSNAAPLPPPRYVRVTLAESLQVTHPIFNNAAKVCKGDIPLQVRVVIALPALTGLVPFRSTLQHAIR